MVTDASEEMHVTNGTQVPDVSKTANRRLYMNRFTALAGALSTALLMTLLAPSAALAGPGGGPGPSIDVPPIFESGSPSAIVNLDAGGYLYGYNMAGTTITGEGVLPAVPPGYALAANDKLGWPDLDGNGISDLVVRDTTTGYLYAYLLQDTGTYVGILSEGAIPALPPGYTLLGWPDLDGNGTSDLVMQSAEGFTYAYLMNGLASTADGQVPGLPAVGGYTTIGFPDLDGSNGADIVIQSAGGYTFAYLMNGLTLGLSGPIPGLPSSGGFTTIGFPNLDGQNGDDVVIQHVGGFTFAYLMNGLVTASSGQVPGLPSTGGAVVDGYSTIGFPDLDGTNGNDIVIQAASGYTFAYIMAGLTSSGSAAIPGLPASDYTTIGFPNLDDANGADVVIQHTGGYTYAYLMNGTATVSDGALPARPVGYTTVPWQTSWAVLP